MVISTNPSAGDMDLDPSTGQYRMSAVVPVVEVNELRATLGVRPLPNPVAGALRGTLHLNGPLEEPLFSGAPHKFELSWMGAPEQACGFCLLLGRNSGLLAMGAAALVPCQAPRMPGRAHELLMIGFVIRHPSRM